MNKFLSYCQSFRTEDKYFNISFVLMMFMMAFLPFTVFFMWPIGIALLLLWVFQGKWREKWENFKTNDGIPYGIFLLAIFLTPLQGFINSSNMPVAWSIFECYTWFLFAPLIFLTISPKLCTPKHIFLLLAIFTISTLLNISSFFYQALVKVLQTKEIKYMYNGLFCYNQHHAYVAMYANFAYLLILHYLLNHQNHLSKKFTAFLVFLELFLILGIFCVYSRAGILTFLFMHTVWCIYAIHQKPSRWKAVGTLFVLIVGLFAVLILTSPQNRFTESRLTFENSDKDKRKTDARLIIWEAAWDAAKDNLPWGVGTGDGNQVVMEQYHANGYWLNRNHPYNAHNQFLFALLTNGIPGLIILLLYFYTPLGLSIKHKDIFLLSLFFIMTLNNMVECMFDRRAGVDFFAVMIPLFMLRIHSIQHQKPLP